MGLETPRLSGNLMKIIINIILCLLLCVGAYASQVTTNYDLVVPAIGDRNWQPIISRDIISIDTILGSISSDIGGSNRITIISTEVSEIREGSAINTGILSVDGISIDSSIRVGFSVGSTTHILSADNEVGRIPIVSIDGSVCYIKIYE